MPNRFTGHLSNYIRHRRDFLGKTQKVVAEAVGVTPDFIALIEAGERRLDLDKVPLLADALEVSRTALCQQALRERAPALYGQLFEQPQPAGA